MVQQKKWQNNTHNNHMFKQCVWDRKEVTEGHFFSLDKAVSNIPPLTSAFLFFFCREVVNWKALVRLLWVWHALINSGATFEVAANRCADVTLVRRLWMQEFKSGFWLRLINSVLAASHVGPAPPLSCIHNQSHVGVDYLEKPHTDTRRT